MKTMLTEKKNICSLLAISSFILFMLIIAAIILSYKKNIGNNKFTALVNLKEAFSEQWISTSGNIKSMTLDGDDLLVIGDGKLTIDAKRLPLECGRQYKFSAELELEELGYRTYATILLTKVKGNRIWQLANSDEIAWQKNVPQKVSINFLWSTDIERSNFVLVAYNRLGFEKTYTAPMVWRVKQISLSEADKGTNADKYIKYAAFFSITIGLIIIWLSGMNDYQYVKHNELSSAPLYMNAAIAFGGIGVLIGIGIIDTFPIEALRLRADAWSYDIVARSIATGFGFKAYDIVELTSYPLVPLYYSIIYKAFGVSVVSVFWGNIILLVAAWISIAFCTLRFDRGHAIISLIVIAMCVPIWVSVTWTLSETPAMVILSWVVIAASQLVKNDNRILWKSVLLGVVLGLASLTRTDFYGLIPLLMAYFFLRKRLKTAFKICMITTMVVAFIVSPWWIFQSNNKQNVLENNYWVSDLQRVTKAFEQIRHGVNIKGDQEVGFRKYSSNFINMVKFPYSKYIIETEPNRMHKMTKLFYIINNMILIVALLLFIVIWRKKPLFLIGLPEIILLVIFARTLFLSALHDSPRYFSHHALVIALLFAISLKEWHSWNACYGTIGDKSDDQI